MSYTFDPSCGLYARGHRIHFIQAKRSWEDDESPRHSGTVVSVRRDGYVTLDLDESVRLWHHDADGFERCVAEHGPNVDWRPRWGVLAIKTRGGSALFCMSHEPSACALAGGGFMVRMADLDSADPAADLARRLRQS